MPASKAYNFQAMNKNIKKVGGQVLLKRKQLDAGSCPYPQHFRGGSALTKNEPEKAVSQCAQPGETVAAHLPYVLWPAFRLQLWPQEWSEQGLTFQLKAMCK